MREVWRAPLHLHTVHQTPNITIKRDDTRCRAARTKQSSCTPCWAAAAAGVSGGGGGSGSSGAAPIAHPNAAIASPNGSQGVQGLLQGRLCSSGRPAVPGSGFAGSKGRCSAVGESMARPPPGGSYRRLTPWLRSSCATARRAAIRAVGSAGTNCWPACGPSCPRSALRGATVRTKMAPPWRADHPNERRPAAAAAAAAASRPIMEHQQGAGLQNHIGASVCHLHIPPALF